MVGTASDGTPEGEVDAGVPDAERPTVRLGDGVAARDELGAALVGRLFDPDEDGVGDGRDEDELGTDDDVVAGVPTPPEPEFPLTALEGRTA